MEEVGEGREGFRKNNGEKDKLERAGGKVLDRPGERRSRCLKPMNDSVLPLMLVRLRDRKELKRLLKVLGVDKAGLVFIQQWKVFPSRKGLHGRGNDSSILVW